MNNKLSFHIPHVAFVNNAYIPVPYEDFENDLGLKLIALGIEGWHIISATGFYKGRKYNQDIFVIYCNDELLKKIISAFKETVSQYHKKMQQEMYAYECNGVMKIYVMA